MDELNKLKKMWDSSFSEEPAPANREQLHALMQSETSGPVDKLKKSLRIEIGAILIAIPLLVVIMFELQKTYFLINTGILILVFTGSLIYYFSNLRRLTRIWNQSQENIRASLESTVMLIRFFRNTYFWLNVILFPIGIYFGYIIGFGLGSGGEKISSLLLDDVFPVYLIILTGFIGLILLFVAFLFFLKFYMRKLYDVHIEKLEEILRELTEFE